jgi:hypothetical protein
MPNSRRKVDNRKGSGPRVNVLCRVVPLPFRLSASNGERPPLTQADMGKPAAWPPLKALGRRENGPGQPVSPLPAPSLPDFKSSLSKN